MWRAACAVVWILAAGCAGDDDTMRGNYSESCTPANGCVDGLVCRTAGAGRLCSKSCTTSADCTGLSDRAFCAPSGTCLDSCRDIGDCPPGLPCTMVGSTQGMCVPNLAQ